MSNSDAIPPQSGSLWQFLRERVRNAWANRCLLCLVHPFHGSLTVIDGEEYEAAKRDPAIAELFQRAARQVDEYGGRRGN